MDSCTRHARPVHRFEEIFTQGAGPDHLLVLDSGHLRVPVEGSPQRGWMHDDHQLARRWDKPKRVSGHESERDPSPHRQSRHSPQLTRVEGRFTMATDAAAAVATSALAPRHG